MNTSIPQDSASKIVQLAIEQKRKQVQQARRVTILLTVGLLTFVMYAVGGAIYAVFRSPHVIPYQGMEAIVARTEIQLLASSIQTTILTVSAIGIAIWLIKVIISFIRYSLSLTNVLQAQADALLLSNGDPDKLRIYAYVLSPSDVQFGEIPASQFEKLIDLAKEAVSRR